MPDTGAPWNIPFLDGTELVRAYPDFSEDLADAVADGLSAAGNAGIGSNVVQTAKTDVFTTTSTSFTNVTGLSATITPSSATSKVLVIAQLAIAYQSNVQIGHWRISGGNATAYVGDAGGSRVRAVFGGWNESNMRNALGSFSIVYLDSPETTSATTYNVQTMRGSALSATVTLNQSAGDADADNNVRTRGASSITVIEVAV